MTRRVLSLPVAFACLAVFVLSANVARAGDHEPDAPKWRTELTGRIHELRTKAEALRLQGSLEDAKHLLNKAAALSQVLELRQASNQAEERAHALKADGRVDEARGMIEESGRLWKKAEEKLRDVDAPRVVQADDIERKIASLKERAAALDAEGKEGAAAETRQQIEMLRKALEMREREKNASAHKVKEPREPMDRAHHLFAAAKHLREAGMVDLAERIEREAESAKQLAARPPTPPAPPPGMSPGEIDALRRELADLRRQLDELRAALR